jgi:dGTP triphosphohydrolase
MNANSSDLEIHLDAMREEISESLEKAEAQRNTLKRKNSRYMTTNIILSALAALLAGTAGTIGNAQNWKITCLFAAACSVGVTVTVKRQTTEQLTEASECVGQLKALKFETVTPTYDLEQVSEKYQQILSDFSAIDL